MEKSMSREMINLYLFKGFIKNKNVIGIIFKLY